MNITSKIFFGAILLLLFVAAQPIARANAAIPAQCQAVLDRYQSGVTPKTLTPLQPHSALYMYEGANGQCGWGTWNRSASPGVIRNAALARCQGHDRGAPIRCTLVGLDGRLVASGVARFSGSVAATAAAQRTTQPQRTQIAALGARGSYSWCRAAVFHKYGSHGPAAPGYSAEQQKNVVWMDAQSVEPMINYCVQQHGMNY